MKDNAAYKGIKINIKITFEVMRLMHPSDNILEISFLN